MSGEVYPDKLEGKLEAKTLGVSEFKKFLAISAALIKVWVFMLHGRLFFMFFCMMRQAKIAVCARAYNLTSISENTTRSRDRPQALKSRMRSHPANPSSCRYLMHIIYLAYWSNMPPMYTHIGFAYTAFTLIETNTNNITVRIFEPKWSFSKATRLFFTK